MVTPSGIDTLVIFEDTGMQYSDRKQNWCRFIFNVSLIMFSYLLSYYYTRCNTPDSESSDHRDGDLCRAMVAGLEHDRPVPKQVHPRIADVGNGRLIANLVIVHT